MNARLSRRRGRSSLTVEGAIGFAIIGVYLAVTIVAPLIAPYGEGQLVGDAWMPPSAQNWLGTDNIGRDLLSRLLFGTQITIVLALAATTFAFITGVLLGFIAAIGSRWLDMALSSLVDLLMAIPQLVLALMVLSVVGTSIPALIGTIVLVDTTRVYRLSRSVAMNIVVLEFVEAARVRGEGAWWIITREILPSAVPPLVTEYGLRFCFTFLFIASLSFLGLGIQPPLADLGNMVRDNSAAIALGGTAPLVPAVAIVLLTIGINLVVNWFVTTRGVAHGEGL